MKVTKYKIVIDLDGELVACTDGHVGGGTSDQRRRMKAAAYAGEEVQLIAPFGDTVKASFDEGDPLGNFAAIVAASARWKILEAPQEIYDFLDSQVIDDETSLAD